MDPRIQEVLEAAIMAPSGDNCQPWKLAVEGMRVALYNDPDRDHSLYNLEQRASLIAHGAFLENLRLAAPAVGLQSTAELFPQASNNNLIARIQFVECETEFPSLYRAIPLRQTNRERYQPVNISDSQAEQWQSLANHPGQSIRVHRTRSEIERLAALLSLNDRLVFEIPALHQFLFEQIRWNDAEAGRTGDGLDIKTLGLSAFDRVSFRMLRYWWLVAALNRVGFSRIIQMKARQNLKSSSALAIVTIPGTFPLDYVEGGKLWQRLLLQVANEGLTAQPVAGLACLLQTAQEDLLKTRLTQPHRNLLLATRQELFDILGYPEETVVLGMFRIGKGRQVTCALRRPLSSFLIGKSRF